MDEKCRKQYEAPAIEVVLMENEGVIAASGESYNPTPMSVQTPRNGASGNDLEEMINDILTIE